MHITSMRNMRKLVEKYLDEKTKLKILDVGSLDLNGSYRHLFDKPKWKYIGADIEEGRNVDIVLSDPYIWKEFGDKSFDVVITGQTLEHVAIFWDIMKEMKRVLKDGGYLFMIAPSFGATHQKPDFYRFGASGFSALISYVGLEELECFTDNVKPWFDTVAAARKPETEVREKEIEKD